MQSRRLLKKLTRKAKAFVQNRKDDGMSVVAILSMAIIISIFLAALYDGILPIYRKVAGLRYANSLRTANEAAVDYLMDQINSGQVTVNAAVGQQQALSVPTTVTQQGTMTPNVIVSVANLGNAPGNAAPNCGPAPNCVLYDRNRQAQYNFLRLTAVGKVGTARRVLTVLLEPIATPTAKPLYASFGAWGTTAVQLVGLAGINAYNLPTVGGQRWKSHYQFADIGSNGAGNQVVARNSHSSIVQAGHQFEFPATSGQFTTAVNLTTSTFNATAASGLTNIDIMGNIYSNAQDDGAVVNGGYLARSQNNMSAAGQEAATVIGATNGYSPILDPNPSVPVDPAYASQALMPQSTPSGIQDGNSPQSKPIPDYTNSNSTNNAIKGSASAAAGGNPGWGNGGAAGNPVSNGNPYTGGYIDSNTGFTQPAIPPAPGAPPGTPNLGSCVVNGTLKIVNGAAPVASINVASGQTLSIPPGNYQMSQLNVGSSGKIMIDPSVSTSTNLYLNPPNTSIGLNAANGSEINTFGANGTPAMGVEAGGATDTPGFKNGGLKGYGNDHNGINLTVDTDHQVIEAPNSGNAMNLTINTNSNTTLNFTGNCRAVVNAPNANVNVGAYGSPSTPLNLNSPANFYGSIVGGVTSILSDWNSGKGAFMHYDLNIKRKLNHGVLTHTDPWSFAVVPAQNGIPIVQYRAVTWQEVTQ